MNWMLWGFLVGAALLEVGGDAMMNGGMKVPPPTFWLLRIAGGGLLLAAYGYAVNLAPKYDRALDLSKLLGVYVAVFAVVATAWKWRQLARFPIARWLGLGLIVVGGAIIHRYGTVPEPAP